MTSILDQFERPISATERLYLAGRPLAEPFAIQLVVEGDGVLDADRLSDAVGAASAACPGARLRRRGVRWVDSGVSPAVTVLDRPGVDLAAPDADPVLTRGLAGDATAEVVLLRGRDTSTVVFRVFHGVMDARGLALWAADVFGVLRGEEPIGAPDPTADHDLVARIGARGKPTTLMPTRRSPLGASGGPPKQGPFLWRHRSVPGVAAASVARISAVLADVVGDRIRVMIPVDLRRHDPALRSTANLALPLFLDISPGEPWSKVHTRILVHMAEKRELAEMDNGGLARLPASVARTVLRGAHRIGAHADRNIVSALVSHAGQVSTRDLSVPGFAVTSVRAVPVHTGLVPVSFVVLECDGTTEITVSCRAGAGVDARLAAVLDRIAEALTASGSTPPSPLTEPTPLVPAATGGPASSTGTADSRFRDHASATPEAPAVSSPDGEYSYAELDRRADAIATALRDRGVDRGDVVAILAGRSVAAVAAQLGVLRAGAAFLALDPKHPVERITGIVDDSGAAVLLAERDRAAAAPSSADVLLLDDLPTSAPEPVRVPITGDDIAYVTYTSGSTGRPKGVRVPHSGVVHFVDGVTDWYGLGPQTRFAHHHTPAADMACAAFFSPLLTGGAVTLVPDDTSHLSLRHMLCESGANTFLFTPSLLDVVLRLDLAPGPVRTVVVGGEQLPPALAVRARDFFGPDVRLLNSYGPAEVSVVCTSHVVAAAPDPATATVPIGRPTAGTDAYLLDEDGVPVPSGEIGELYFTGPQVAAGYLGRPDLTAERFVDLTGGVRSYRTGDLARVLPDGSLDFVGRVDGQVKVRGNRVEPGEVRAALERCPGVSAAAVVGRRTDAGGVLEAYIVASGDGRDVTSCALGAHDVTSRPQVDEAAVRAFLADQLPSYMVPTHIHRVDELPLTDNGKLDVSRLPSGGTSGPAASDNATGDAAPETTAPETEAVDSDLERISAIWVSVLAVDPSSVVPSSDFFALGGDSLASLEMLAQVSKTVVGPDGEAAFVARLEGLVQQMTLARVHEAAVAARDGVDPS
ncbi:non-ribosomal peptide synthetase [Rhodococcus gannanensis]|uniref:Non-ribosomal peptide synthetase n=1 Tax=Rhodococcus gannanensis TaxID=1960308 RepID=A0ABW4P387_9NOCA